MLFISDNPTRDADSYDRWQEKRAERLPVCTCCGERIYSDYALFIDDEWYCEDCERDNAHDLWMDFGRDQYIKGVEI